MAGTTSGGKKAAEKNIDKYGKDFYKRIGAKGGRNGNTGGFASKVRGNDGMTGQERAVKYGAVGGRISKRTKRY